MRLIVGLLACVSVGGICVAWADPPSSNSTATPAAAAPSSAPTAQTAAPTAKAAPATAAVEDPAVARRLRAAGYHSEMHSGVKVWCKTEESLGSRLSSGGPKICGTAKELDAATAETQARMQEELNLQHNTSGH